LAVDFLQDCPNAPGAVFTKSGVGSRTGMASWWIAQVPWNTKRSCGSLLKRTSVFLLLALYSRASNEVDDDWHELVEAYLPGCASGASLLVVDLGAANHGLGSTNPLHSIVTLDELPLSLAASHILLLYIYIKFGMLLVRLRY
jgi:hypothetical protein